MLGVEGTGVGGGIMLLVERREAVVRYRYASFIDLQPCVAWSSTELSRQKRCNIERAG